MKNKNYIDEAGQEWPFVPERKMKTRKVLSKGMVQGLEDQISKIANKSQRPAAPTPSHAVAPTASHKPLPWHVGGVHLENGKPQYHGIGNGQAAIARALVTGVTSYEEAYANAAFIVRAVNTHEEMLIALKNFVGNVGDCLCCGRPESLDCQPDCNIEIARKAIAKAEESSNG